LLLSGNDYIEIGRNDAAAPVALYLLQPDRVSAKTNLSTDAEYTRHPAVTMWGVRDAKGNPYPVAPADMVQSKLFNPLDPIYGMSPLEAAMLHVRAENEGAELTQRLLERGHVPGWIEATKDSIWEDTQVAQLRERMRATKRAGEELFLENATYHEMGFTPLESGVAQQQVLSKRDIASVFHVPAQLIGDTVSQTYSNYQEARRALYMEAVVPLLSQFRDDWNHTVGDQLGSLLQFDKDSFDAIAAARAEATDRVYKLWSSGLIMQNEARRDLEYDPVPGGDVFYAPANFLPLASGDVGEGS
jgi:HK97 family phage portal protein